MITIEKSGVVYFQDGYETRLMVDRTDLLAELEEALSKFKPSSDYDGRFAGRVKISVEFLAEMEALLDETD